MKVYNCDFCGNAVGWKSYTIKYNDDEQYTDELHTKQNVDDEYHFIFYQQRDLCDNCMRDFKICIRMLTNG